MFLFCVLDHRSLSLLLGSIYAFFNVISPLLLPYLPQLTIAGISN